jgi:hypothetical protein
MDFRKKENVILKEIERVKAEIKEKNDVLSWKKWIIKKQEEDIIKQREKIRELDLYIKTLERFRGVIGISE